MGMIKFILTVVTCFGFASSQRLTKCVRDEGNPPDGYKCFARGTLPNPDVLRDFKTGLALNPFDTCRDACLDLGAACGSYSLNQADSRCRLYKRTLTAQGFQRGTPPNKIFYWDNLCWKSACVTSNTKQLTDRTLAYDDENFRISLPFPISIYHRSTSTVFMSANGFISMSDAPSSSWRNAPLPVYNGVGADNLPTYSVCGFWRDLMLQNVNGWDKYFNPDQMLSYTISGVSPTRTVTFTWKTTYAQNSGILDMDMTFKENQPNIVTILYRQVYTDNGSGSTLGAQSQPGGQYIDPIGSGNQVYQGVQLILDTNANTYDFVYP